MRACEGVKTSRIHTVEDIPIKPFWGRMIKESSEAEVFSFLFFVGFFCVWQASVVDLDVI